MPNPKPGEALDELPHGAEILRPGDVVDELPPGAVVDDGAHPAQVPVQWPEAKSAEQDRSWEELSSKADAFDKLKAFLGGLVPYASNISGGQDFSRPMSEHPWYSAAGQVVQQGALNKALPGSAAVSLPARASRFAAAGGIGKASELTNTNPNDSLADHAGEIQDAAAISGILGPATQYAIPKAIGYIKSKFVTPVKDAAISASNDIDDGVSRMLTFLGKTGEEREAIMKNPELKQKLYEQFVASKPSILNTNEKMLSDATTRTADAEAARDAAAKSIGNRISGMTTEDVAGPVDAQLAKINSPTGNPADADILNIMKQKYAPVPGIPPSINTNPGSISYGQVNPGTSPTASPIDPNEFMSSINQIAGGHYGDIGASATGKGLAYQGTGAQRSALTAAHDALSGSAARSGIPVEEMANYKNLIGDARSAREYQSALSNTISPPAAGGGSFSVKTIIPNIASHGLRGAASRMSTGRAVDRVSAALEKLSEIPEAKGINPFDTGVLRQSLQAIKNAPPEEQPVLEYVLAKTNPAYMAIKRSLDDEQQ